MENRSWIQRVDWGHTLLVVGIAVAICLYLYDTVRASAKVGNLVLILPASILGLLLCGLTLAGIVNDARKQVTAAPREARSDEEVTATSLERFRPAYMLALFGVYILLIPVAGMDGASALFLAAALYLNGERRIWFVVLYAVIFAAAATWFFKSILPYPLHTLFF